MITRIITLLICAISLVTIGSCGKTFLDTKPIKNQEVPTTLEDFSAMLNHSNMSSYPSFLSMVGGEDFWVTDAGWNSFPLGLQYYQKNAYVWADDVFEGANAHDWSVGHSRILTCNIILDGLEKHQDNKGSELYNLVKGTALFHRARYLYNIAQIFAYPYNSEEDSPYGLPFYLNSSITESTYRRSVNETYKQILADLNEALTLLPLKAPIKQQPDRTSCKAMLARTYLQMGDFNLAYQFADETLSIQSELIDFNKMNLAAAYPFPIDGIGNPEIIFYEFSTAGNLMARTRMNIHNELINSYEIGDLRRMAFILDDPSGRKIYKGSYLGSYSFFIGMATDEMYLIRAESAAHLDKLDIALSDLNNLRKHRFSPIHFSDFKTTDKEQLLTFIMDERRRELPFRNRRWEDLRRWNILMSEKITIKRNAGGITHELSPENPKWTWPLPELAVQFGGYIPNPR